jgi:hypothetical protein
MLRLPGLSEFHWLSLLFFPATKLLSDKPRTILTELSRMEVQGSGANYIV